MVWVMKWLVSITADAGDLDELSALPPNSLFAIRREGAEFVLESSLFENVSTAEEVKARAHLLVELMSGASSLAYDARRPFSVGSVIGIDDDGNRHIFVSCTINVSTRLTAHATITHADGSTEEILPAQPVPVWVDRAQADATAQEILRVWGTQPKDWVNLYNLLERVEHAVGGERGIVERGWASRKALDKFRRTACSPDVLGPQARHGVQKFEPPRKPMSLPEARALIRSVVVSWLTE